MNFVNARFAGSGKTASNEAVALPITVSVTISVYTSMEPGGGSSTLSYITLDVALKLHKQTF